MLGGANPLGRLQSSACISYFFFTDLYGAAGRCRAKDSKKVSISNLNRLSGAAQNGPPFQGSGVTPVGWSTLFVAS